jgi:hypothetical protein
MAMVRKGGSNAKGGMYWKKGEWEIVTVEGENGTLPGTEDLEYLRIPGILFGPVALIMGLAFYLFLPFIGFAMLLSVIVKKIASRLMSPAVPTHSGKGPIDLHVPPGTSRHEHIRPGGGMS